jgi:hypothetical protein
VCTVELVFSFQPEQRAREKNEALEEYKLELAERLFVSEICIELHFSAVVQSCRLSSRLCAERGSILIDF